MSKSKVTITGLAEIQRNMSKMARQIQGRTREGMKAAGLAVQANAMDYTPVLTGNLRASFSVRTMGSDMNPVVRVINVAAYSLSVHELNVPYLQLGMIDTPVLQIITDRARI